MRKVQSPLYCQDGIIIADYTVVSNNPTLYLFWEADLSNFMLLVENVIIMEDNHEKEASEV